MNKETRVIVGMSGGVDSSVSAFLLQQQGYQVEGLFMKNWEEDDNDEYCAAAEDLADAQSVCDQLDIPLHTVNFSAEYWDSVFSYFLEEYAAGRTPNPDIMCNKEIKFKAFLDYALQIGADIIATGHYARSSFLTESAKAAHTANLTKTLDSQHNHTLCMLRGVDSNKDQTYFLYTLGQRQLGKTLFPVGELAKDKVRKIAAEQGFTNARKKDSTGICFIGERRFSEFLSHYLPANPGNIKTLEGEVIGQHQGLMYHTLGQRKGLKIGGLKHAAETPWFVIDKLLDDNELIVAQGHDHPANFHNALDASQLHWIAGYSPLQSNKEVYNCGAKIRYRQADVNCQFRIENNRVIVYFDEAQRAITPGQSIVFYQQDRCIGGGIIEKRYNQKAPLT